VPVTRRTFLIMSAAALHGACTGGTGARTPEAQGSGAGPATVRAPIASPESRLQSHYVPTHDGTLLAVDVWLPTDLTKDGSTVGTVLKATRYHRASANTTGRLEDDTNFEDAAAWNGAGLAYVIVDARGSGASFGERLNELSVAEIADYGSVLNWVGSQTWSNGAIAMTGASYAGNTAELTARLGNPHLVAIAPLFSDWDPYTQLVYPGGVYAVGAFGTWVNATRVMDGIDGAATDVATQFGVPVEAIPELIPPVKPVVSGPEGMGLLADAQAEHQTNADVGTLAAQADCRDDQGSGVSWTEVSVPTWGADIEFAGVPAFIRTGWIDAGTAEGALTRFVTRSTTTQIVEIGPWSHGGSTLGDPFRAPDAAAPYKGTSRDDQRASLLEFMEAALTPGRSPIVERSLRYATLGEDGWRTTKEWPEQGTSTRRLHLGPAGDLSEKAVGEPTETAHMLDPQATSGPQNRWIGNVLGTQTVYPDRAEADSRLIVFDTAPLVHSMRIIGFPILSVTLSTDADNGAVFAYLGDVSPDGRVTYITEGQLLFAHRAVADGARPPGLGIARTYARADRLPVTPGEPMNLLFHLAPTAARFRAGHRIRLSISGGDDGTFRSVGQMATTFKITHGTTDSAWLDLPVGSET
jgi:putative CocE/NonD family hydrolase